MATQPIYDLATETLVAPKPVRRHLAIVPDAGNYDELERTAPDRKSTRLNSSHTMQSRFAA